MSDADAIFFSQKQKYKSETIVIFFVHLIELGAQIAAEISERAFYLQLLNY